MELRDRLEEILRNYARVEQVAARNKNRERSITVFAADTV